MKYFAKAEYVIRKRQQKLRNRADFFALIKRIIFIGAAVTLFFCCFVSVTKVSGNAMYPSVRDGDLLIGYRHEEKFERDDIVTYSVCDQQVKTGRILCAGSDVIYIDSDGFLFVNGTRQSGVLMDKKWFKGISEYPYTIPGNYVLVFADVLADEDYEKTEDYSSYVRLLNVADIKSKIITVIRRRGF